MLTNQSITEKLMNRPEPGRAVKRRVANQRPYLGLRCGNRRSGGFDAEHCREAMMGEQRSGRRRTRALPG